MVMSLTRRIQRVRHREPLFPACPWREVGSRTGLGLYYTRVIEVPTPRWTAYDEVRFGIKMAPEVTRVLQERAYTSPIWYTPWP